MRAAAPPLREDDSYRLPAARFTIHAGLRGDSQEFHRHTASAAAMPVDGSPAGTGFWPADPESV